MAPTSWERQSRAKGPLPVDVYDGSGNFPGLNAVDDVAFDKLLRGEGTGPENKSGLWVATPKGTILIGQAGDPVPELGPGVLRVEAQLARVCGTAR